MSAAAAQPDAGRTAGINANAVLAIVAVAQFMVILDASIVNVALPTIKRDVGFSEQSLSWILNAYTLIFGGFLLLGGRAADRLGRRRLFMAGIALFSLASLVCGVSQTEGELLVARGFQGLGGAMVSPAALSIILTTFAEGPERNRALSVWGAIAGAGGAVGLLLGGVLVQLLSWRWVFFVNVPIGVLVLALAPRIVPESRSEAAAKGGYDIEGAVTITLGTMALVFTLIKATAWGWTSGRTIAGFVVSAVLIAAFVVIERRHEDPLVPLRASGMSTRKVATLRALAERFVDSQLTDESLARMTDQEVEATLTDVRGIGPWTAHGFLIVALDRPDVLLPGDLALRLAVQRAYGFDHLPTEDEMVQVAERWRPYRSLAVSYLFASEFEKGT